nr:retrovirus-related Pol polyprotein from transposon TNT 1-94 [Tanacetum cinerariifolium]
QLLFEQVPGNIVKALGGKGIRKEKISSKEVIFTKADESFSVLTPEITSNLESEYDSQEHLLPLPKLIGATPSGTSEIVISLSDLTLNMADLTLNTPYPKKTRPSVKVSHAYVIKKKAEKSPTDPNPCYDKKVDSSTEQLFLTLMEEYALLPHLKPQTHWVPTAVLTKSKPILNTTVRPVTAARPNIPVTRSRNTHQVVTKSKSPIRRHITCNPSSKTSNSPPRVNAVQVPVVSVVQGKQGTWDNPQQALIDKGVIDSGCSRHMTGNMFYLFDFEELNGGYVAFEGNLKGNKITGKGKIKTCKLDFDDVYFVKEFKFNLFRKGKQHRASCKTKLVSSVDQPLFRLYMDLFGPTFVKSLNKISYCPVITDDYSRFTWVFFLATKDETTPILKTFLTGLENQLSLKGIKREFSVPRTPQQNGIAERKNMTLIEAARTMLADSLLPIPFWAEAVNTACYVQNRVLVTKPHNKTPYELLHGRTPNIGFMRPFGCPMTILNTLDPLGIFQGKVDEGFLVGYSVCSKAFRVFNSRIRIIQETLHVNFLENKPNVAEDAAFDGKEHDFDVKKPESQVILSPSSSAQSKKQDDQTKKEAKRKSPVESVTGYRDLNVEFQDFSENSSNEVTTASTIVPTVGQNSFNSTNTFSAADMLGLEDIIYYDDEDVVGAEADFNNLESSIPVSLILTTRIHKDHPVSLIIGDLSSTTQTRCNTPKMGHSGIRSSGRVTS